MSNESGGKRGRRLRTLVGNSATDLWKNYKWIWPLIIAAVFSLADPFGIGSAAERRSHDVFMRIMSPFYSSDGYNSMAVVLIDDEYLADKGETYPMAREHYFELLDVVISGNPEMIFVDIHFPRDRDDPEVTRALGAYIAAEAFNPLGVTIGEADKPHVFTSDLGGPPTLVSNYSLFDQVETLPVRIRNVGTGRYPLCMDEEGVVADCGIPGARQSPALELYYTLCERNIATGCERISSNEPMLLQWSRQPEPGRPDCGPAPATVLKKLSMVGALIVEGAVRNKFLDSPLNQPCFPYQTVSAATIVQSDIDVRKAAFEGQVVFIGTLFRDAPDLTWSPVHGELPGLFVHATAFDNLFTFGNRYWKADGSSIISGLSLSRFIELVALFSVAAVFARASHIQRRLILAGKRVSEASVEQEMSEARRRLASGMLYGAGLLTVCVAISLLVPIFFGLPPTNFYGLIALTLPLSVALIVSSLAQWFMVSIEGGIVGKLVQNWRITLATAAIAAIFLFLGGLIWLLV